MKRISILLSCLLLAIGGSAQAQGGTISVTAEAEAKEPATAAGTPTRILTNVGAPGTGGQTGESRTSTVGTTGGYHAPGNPALPSKADGDSMSNEAMAANSATASTNSLPRTASHEPTILLIGLGALVAALLMFRRRASV